MAIKATSQISIVDLSDSRQLSAYLSSNNPKIQIENPNVLPHTYNPDWSSAHVTITPSIFLNQTPLALNASGLTLTWKRKDGVGSEVVLITGETVSGNILTLSNNVLATSTSGLLTYVCYISYFDTETQNTVNISTDISYSLVKNATDARLASISGGQVFKYDKAGVLTGATQIALDGLTQGVTLTKWQYKNGSDVWTDYPTTADNANITSSTLIVKPAHAIFFNNTALLRLVTSDANVQDTHTITKLQDGATGNTGGPGAAGVGGLSVILGNEAQIIATDAGGLCTATTITISITAYLGTVITPCTLTTPTGLPSGMTAAQTTTSNVITLTLTVAAQATLGGGTQGIIPLVIVSNSQTVTKYFSWSKAIKGASGTNGTNGVSAVTFCIYAPTGTVVSNQTGTLTLNTQGYFGSTAITIGATYLWQKYDSGSWTSVGTTSSISVTGSSIINIATYKCTMTYSNKTYVDIITLEDKTDSMIATVISTGGNIFKNGLGSSHLICRLVSNGQEVDTLLATTYGVTAPTSPAAGTFWYKTDTTAKTVVLMKYSGTAWAVATEVQDNTYNWYRLDYNGNALDGGAIFKTGKIIYVSDGEVNIKTSFICEVV